MKKALSIFIFAITSQVIFAHPGSEHHHESFIGEWAWLIIPAIAIAGLIWKFGNKKMKKIEK